ncbi:ATP-binding protein [Thermomonospora umbrina]|uniref:Histidine kinase-like protein n=1 Tax=Thermomonospora umbrina TaxID=111806 RepID=A0A3D9SX28_9ACTN|nr:ATP-binding protein [Thermomonospora umbrina]REF00399.1 histidine kinase-like protein [Thermomonospora umbrina]
MGTKRLGADGRTPHGAWAGAAATGQTPTHPTTHPTGQWTGHAAGPGAAPPTGPTGPGGPVGGPGGPVGAPEGVREVSWELPGEVGSAARARALTRRALFLWRAEAPADVDDVVLMVDELVANAIIHGGGRVLLRLRLDGSALTCEVADDSPLIPRRARRDAGPGDWAETGRGLLLVAALADDHGTRPHGRGKAVWFTRPLSRAGPPPTADTLPPRTGEPHAAR